MLHSVLNTIRTDFNIKVSKRLQKSSDCLFSKYGILKYLKLSKFMGKHSYTTPVKIYFECAHMQKYRIYFYADFLVDFSNITKSGADRILQLQIFFRS